jgi:hypothetical protein
MGHRRVESARREAGLEVPQVDRAHAGVSAGVPTHQLALARPATRVRVTPGRTRRAARAGSRPARARIDHNDRALRQPKSSKTCKPQCSGSRVGRHSIQTPSATRKIASMTGTKFQVSLKLRRKSRRSMTRPSITRSNLTLKTPMI